MNNHDNTGPPNGHDAHCLAFDEWPSAPQQRRETSVSLVSVLTPNSHVCLEIGGSKRRAPNDHSHLAKKETLIGRSEDVLFEMISYVHREHDGIGSGSFHQLLDATKVVINSHATQIRRHTCQSCVLPRSNFPERRLCLRRPWCAWKIEVVSVANECSAQKFPQQHTFRDRMSLSVGRDFFSMKSR